MGDIKIDHSVNYDVSGNRRKEAKSKVSSDLEGMLHGIADINGTINSGSLLSPSSKLGKNEMNR